MFAISDGTILVEVDSISAGQGNHREMESATVACTFDFQANVEPAGYWWEVLINWPCQVN